jgi:ribonuclease VapC
VRRLAETTPLSSPAAPAPAAVVDASALLAAVLGEPGREQVERVVPGAAISTVNWSEFVQNGAARGADIATATAALDALGLVIIPFDRADAERAAALWELTRGAGLSLGDRACLALALRLGAPAYTADRSWTTVEVGVDVRAIR